MTIKRKLYKNKCKKCKIEFLTFKKEQDKCDNCYKKRNPSTKLDVWLK